MEKPKSLWHEVQGASALDLASDLTMHLGWDSRHATRKDFARGRGEFRQQIGIGMINLVNRDVLATAGHATVRLTESNATLDCFWFGFLHIR